MKLFEIANCLKSGLTWLPAPCLLVPDFELMVDAENLLMIGAENLLPLHIRIYKLIIFVMENLSLSMALNAKRIVLTDDDEDDRDFFQFAIKSISSDIELITLTGGDDLIYYMGNHRDKADLIFLDINMPRINGFECLRKIREKYSYSELPVVMYTTSDSELDLANASKDGANLYVRKPNDMDALKKVLRKVLEMDFDPGVNSFHRLA